MRRPFENARLGLLAVCAACTVSPTEDLPRDAGRSLPNDGGALERPDGGDASLRTDGSIRSDGGTMPGDAGRPDAGRPDAGDVAAEVDAFCRAQDVARWSGWAACFGGTGEEWLLFLGGPSGCREVAASVVSGRIRFDAAAARSCLDELATRPCTQILTWPESCAAAFTGLLPPGSACIHRECAPGSECDDYAAGTGQCSRRCVTVNPLPEGAACTPYQHLPDRCTDGSYCAPDGCQPLPPANGPTLPDGAPCDPESFDSGCQENSRCAETPEGARCTPRQRLHEPCEVGARECTRVFAYCAQQADGSGRCTLRPAEGEACDVTAREPSYCAFGACSSRTGRGVCLPPTPVGAACDEASVCEDGLCEEGVCTRLWSCPD